jgi:hypothetical protein
MKEERKVQEKRLKEIQSMTFAGLSDDAILELLAERKHLENVVLEYQKQDALVEESAHKHESLLQEEKVVEDKIAHLNEEIGPDKKDEELLELIQARKVLEEELLHIEQELKEPLPGAGRSESSGDREVSQAVAQLPEIAPAPEVPREAAPPVEVPAPEAAKEENSPKASQPIFKQGDFGDQGIGLDGLQESGDFEKYVHQLESSRDSLGGFLQSLPRDARRNKSFMLKVASIDPAYAMHYAADALRQDEDFHIQIASMRNSRGSGNALAEMDLEMRTGQVVLVGTREDFRNVHFVREDMPEYDEILKTAKKSALEKISDLKEAVDLTALIPKILQRDEAFMQQVQTVSHKNQPE